MHFQSKHYQIIRKVVMGIFTFLCCFFFCASGSYAETAANVVSSKVVDKDLLLYVSGIDSSDIDVSLIIGNTAIDSGEISVTPMVDTEYPIHTVLLLDNSISLKKIWEKNAKKLMEEIIDGHAPNEVFEIATYAEGLSVVSEFTNNYEGLKTTINGITYVNQSSYLTDILYEMVDSFKKAGEPYFVRIVVICDGSDDNEISYTNAELTKLLSESGIPVDTIGAADKSNSKALELLFSYARASGGQSLKVTNKDDTSGAKDMLTEDYKIRCIRVGLPWSLKDGSVKAAQLTLKSGGEEHVITTNLTMPFDVPNEYTVSFSDESGEKVIESIAVKEGETPVYAGNTPLKDEDEKNTYTFVGWSDGTTTYASGDALPTVTADTTFKAVFSAEAKTVPASDDLLVQSAPKAPRRIVPWYVWLIAAAIMAVVAAIVLVVILVRRSNNVSGFHELEPLDNGQNNNSSGGSSDISQDNGETNGSGDRKRLTRMIVDEDPNRNKTGQSGTKTIKLTLENCNNQQEYRSCSFSESAIIGWDTDNDISLSFDDTVSGKHCKIEKIENAYYLSDLNSTNHTYYYGKKDYNNTKNRVEVTSDVVIADGDVIEIGKGKYRIKIEDRHLTQHLIF